MFFFCEKVVTFQKTFLLGLIERCQYCISPPNFKKEKKNHFLKFKSLGTLIFVIAFKLISRPVSRSWSYLHHLSRIEGWDWSHWVFLPSFLLFPGVFIILLFSFSSNHSVLLYFHSWYCVLHILWLQRPRSISTVINRI